MHCFHSLNLGFSVFKVCCGLLSIFAGHIVQSVMCLTTDPGVACSILARSYPFVEIDHKIISTAILLASAESRAVVSYKGKYVHKVVVNCLVKLTQEKSVVR